jgi:hypothetical protein
MCARSLHVSSDSLHTRSQRYALSSHSDTASQQTRAGRTKHFGGPRVENTCPFTMQQAGKAHVGNGGKDQAMISKAGGELFIFTFLPLYSQENRPR